jgi:hypothetical protein
MSHGQTSTFNGATSISEIRARAFYILHYEVIGKDRIYWLASSFQSDRLRKMTSINLQTYDPYFLHLPKLIIFKDKFSKNG